MMWKLQEKVSEKLFRKLCKECSRFNECREACETYELYECKIYDALITILED